MDADRVDGLDQFLGGGDARVSGGEVDAVRQLRIIEQHVHIEGLGAAGRRRADPAKADDAELSPAQPVETGGRVVAPAGHRVFAQRVVEGDDAPAQRQEQRHGMVGDLGRAVVGHVAHGDPHRAQRLQVEIVEPDAAAHDDAAVLQFACHRHGVDRLAFPEGLDALGPAPGVVRHLGRNRVEFVLAGLAEHGPLDLGVVREPLVHQQ